MNIFNKKLKAKASQYLPINPVELYQTCPYKEGYGYLRGIQEEVLNAWNDRRAERDIICKMNTGSGKTMTGLLMLYSKLVEKVGPCLYVCPDNQLLDQTVKLAGLYGIPVCTFDESHSGVIPTDFINCKKILVTNFHKLFNGKSIFKRDNIHIGGLLLDDAHKCVDIARDNSTIKLLRSNPIGSRLFDLFTDDLKHQLPGNFYNLRDGDPTITMRVPYWTWMDNHEKILQIVNEHIKSLDENIDDNDKNLIFNWNIARNNLLSYDCYISGNELEISPIHVPYHEMPSLNEAKHRFILSATFEDDYDLIKDLGISYESILNPIIPTNRKDVGKRLILAPARFDSSLIDNKVGKFIAEYPTEGFNTIVLVPSKARAIFWEDLGATIVDKNNIHKALAKLETSSGNFMVFVNRYDGVDLHNNLCRILVIDGLPIYNSLQEHYNEVRIDSLKAGKKAQIIEQGLGRSTRSGGDYCVVYLMGIDLTAFMGLEQNLSHFTPVTRAQISLGLNLLDGERPTGDFKTIKETATYCLTQDESWHRYHTQAISETSSEKIDVHKERKLMFADIEKRALDKFSRRNYTSASDIILTEISNKLTDLKEKEQAWYYQFAAQLLYLDNKIDSNNLQIKACNITTRMFHPQQVNIYKKLKTKDIQSAEVRRIIQGFERYQDIMMHVNNILKGLQFNPEITSQSFETSLEELGKFLGFSTQMPERDLGNGPDVLWCMTDGHFLILEAKSRATHKEITRENIEQLLHSEEWFKQLYPNMPYSAVTLQSTGQKGRNVNVSSKTVALDQEGLDDLHANLKQFANALQGVETNRHTEREIETLLIAHKFTAELFRKEYLTKLR